MSYNITLNSTNVVQGTSNSAYQYNFLNGAFDVPDGAEMCISQITIPYSWVNVSSALGNNVFGYALPVGSTTPTIQYFSITLADGFYDINKLNTALQTTFKANGHYYVVPPTSGSTNPTFYYPIVLSYNTTLYCNQINYYCLPANTASGNYKDITNIYGTGAVVGAWTNATGGDTGYPTDATYWHTTGTAIAGSQNWASLFIPQTVTSPNSIGYLLGFNGATSTPTYVPSKPTGFTSYGTFYPAITSGSGSTQIFGQGTSTNPNVKPYTYFLTINGNSLSVSPTFAPLGSSVNGIVVRCNLVDNKVTGNTDILDSFPITTTYGSNLNYSAQIENWIKLKQGRYNNLVVYFADQNLNQLKMLDNNVLITLLIRFPK